MKHAEGTLEVNNILTLQAGHPPTTTVCSTMICGWAVTYVGC